MSLLRSFDAEADAALAKLYASTGATTATHKVNLLQAILGGAKQLLRKGGGDHRGDEAWNLGIRVDLERQGLLVPILV